MAKKKGKDNNGGKNGPSFPELRKRAKVLDIKAAGMTTEQLLEAILDEIAKKYAAGDFGEEHEMLDFYNEYSEKESDDAEPEKETEEAKPDPEPENDTTQHLPEQPIKQKKTATAKQPKSATPKKKKARAASKAKPVEKGKEKKDKVASPAAEKKEKDKPTDIVIADKRLPATVEGLRDFIIVGKEKLKAQKAKINAIEKVNLAYVAKAAALSDAQDLAEILLDAEIRLGVILRADAESGQRARSSKDEGKRLKDYGISGTESHQAQKLAKAVDVVEEVKEAAREEGAIPTSKDVFKLIRKKAPKQERTKKVKKLKVSKAFKRSAEAFKKAVLIEKKKDWKDTDKEAVLFELKALKELII